MEPPQLGFVTKVVAPRQRRDLIPRPRLLELFDSGAEAEVIAAIAPAGYGKTTLLLQYAAASGLPTCWLSLDSFDGEPARLLSYLITSLDQYFPGLAEPLLPALSVEDDCPRHLRECLARLVSSVHLRATSPFLLLLDDVHVLDGTPAAREILDPLLRNLPHACRLVLSGRKLPDLAVLQRLRARRQLEHLGAEDLAFTPEEAATLVESISGGRAAADVTQALLEQSEGWAAALALGARAARRSRSPAASSREELFGYLCAEAYEELSGERQELLLVASVPRQLSEPLLDGLLGAGEGERLEELLAEDLLIQRIDGPRPHYRMHQLYRDFLQERLKRSGRGRYRELHGQAARLLSAAGEWQEAVFHCAEAEDFEQAAAIIEQAAPQAARAGQWRGLTVAIAALPATLWPRYDGLFLIQVHALVKLGEVLRAAKLLDRLLPTMQAKGPSILLAQTLLHFGSTLRGSGRLHEAREQFGRGIKMLLESDASISSVADARRQLGICAGMLGDFDQARTELEHSLEVFTAGHDPAAEASIHDALGICLNRLGHFGDALAHYHRASELWRQLGDLSGLANTLVNAGTLYLEQGDEESAERQFIEAMRAARDAGSTRHEVYATLGIGDIAMARNDLEKAFEDYTAALGRASGLGESFPLTYACCGLSEQHRRRLEFQQAQTVVNARLAELTEEGNRLERGLCLMQLGLAQRDSGSLREATGALTEAAGLFASQHARREEARTSFILASVQFQQRRRRQALPLLDRVAEIVEELGSEQAILAEAKAAPLLLQYAAAHRAGNGLYARLVRRLLERGATEEVAAGAAKYPPVVVRALGPVEVSVGERAVTDLEWRSTSSKELFLYLMSERQEQRRDEIVAAVWPDADPEHSVSLFHSNVYRMRQALYPDCLTRANGRYALNGSGGFESDVDSFERLLAESDRFPRGSEQRAACLRDALRLYRGPFAEEFFSEWVAVKRSQLEERYVRASASLAGYYAGRGEYEASIELCGRILAVDIYHEGATLELMRSWSALGELPQAVRVYRDHRELLNADGMGDPSPLLTRLHDKIERDLGAVV